jgi:hypothetical protein
MLNKTLPTYIAHGNIIPRGWLLIPGSPQEDSQSMLLAGTGAGNVPEADREVACQYLIGYQVYTHPLCNSLEDKVIVCCY